MNILNFLAAYFAIGILFSSLMFITETSFYLKKNKLQAAKELIVAGMFWPLSLLYFIVIALGYIKDWIFKGETHG